eukprot:9474984-Pyramimonas_sp.AAC.1
MSIRKCSPAVSPTEHIGSVINYSTTWCVRHLHAHSCASNETYIILGVCNRNFMRSAWLHKRTIIVSEKGEAALHQSSTSQEGAPQKEGGAIALQ